MNKNIASTIGSQMHSQQAHAHTSSKPLVALLDGRDCSVEMPLLKDIATVAFCDAGATAEIHEKVLNEAVAVLLYSIRLGREDLQKFRSLKLIVKIGCPEVQQCVNLVAASQQGIAVCNTPTESIEETAEHTISLILNMYRRTFWVAKAVQEGKHVNNAEQLRELMSGARRVRGSILGVVGFGNVGCAVALRAKALGFRVIYFDPQNSVIGMDRACGIECTESLNELLAKCDCLTLHCSLSSETRHLLNNETLRRLKSGAFLVNTAASDLVDSQALVMALKSGHLKAAALDLDLAKLQRSKEEQIYLETLASLPNVICTPGCAWFSDESLKEMRISAAKEVRRALTGPIPENLQNCVNKSELLNFRLANIQQRQPPPFLAGNGNTEEFHVLPQNGDSSTVQFGRNLVQNNATMQQMGKDGQQQIPNLTSQNLEFQGQMPFISGNPAADHQSNNTAALLAYQNLMLRNPQLLMTAGGGLGMPMSAGIASAVPFSQFGTSSRISALPNHEFLPPESGPSKQPEFSTSHQFAQSSSPARLITSKSPAMPHQTSPLSMLLTKPGKSQQNGTPEIDVKTEANLQQNEEHNQLCSPKEVERSLQRRPQSGSNSTASPQDGQLFIAEERDDEDEEGGNEFHVKKETES